MKIIKKKFSGVKATKSTHYKDGRKMIKNKMQIYLDSIIKASIFALPIRK